MSLITRCPACGTLFNVVADQLRVSQGWVRCGHCSDVFDAGSHLQPVTDDAASPEVLRASNDADAGGWVAREPSDPVATLADQEPSPSPSTAVDPAEPLVHEEDSSSVAVPHADVGEPDTAFHDVSFLRQARRQAFWRRNSVRAASAVLGLVLLALLGLQWVIQHKDSLALMDTRWTPVLRAVCQPLNCVVKPLRRVESLVIDSSSFSKSGAESFRLSFVLKNTADLPLEAPLLELTLTDTQDKAILRRVLTPAQFGYLAGALLPARAEVAGVVSLSVANEGSRPAAVSAAAVAGYRVLVFYP